MGFIGGGVKIINVCFRDEFDLKVEKSELRTFKMRWQEEHLLRAFYSQMILSDYHLINILIFTIYQNSLYIAGFKFKQWFYPKRKLSTYTPGKKIKHSWSGPAQFEKVSVMVCRDESVYYSLMMTFVILYFPKTIITKSVWSWLGIRNLEYRFCPTITVTLLYFTTTE